jgi:hypothetical protein
MHCDRVSSWNGLNLGNVQVIASAKLKGKDLCLMWRPPFCVGITYEFANLQEWSQQMGNLWNDIRHSLQLFFRDPQFRLCE